MNEHLRSALLWSVGLILFFGGAFLGYNLRKTDASPRGDCPTICWRLYDDSVQEYRECQEAWYALSVELKKCQKYLPAVPELGCEQKLEVARQGIREMLDKLDAIGKKAL